MYTTLPDFDRLFQEGRNIRLHGNRFIQIDVGVSHRVHIWSDVLPMAQERPAIHHDHNYGFSSTVLAGELLNITYRIAQTIQLSLPDARFPYEPKQAYNQRCFDIYHVDGNHGTLIPTYKAALLKVDNIDYYRRGGNYRMWRKQIHATSYVGHAITCVTPESRSDNPIRVFVPHGVNPDNRFRRDQYSAELLWDKVKLVYSSIHN